MAGYTVVSDVSMALVNTLTDDGEMVNPESLEEIKVGLASPDDPGEYRLTVYLYQVSENGYVKNAKRQEIDATRSKQPPLTLDLYYLLTAHPTADTDGNQQNQLDTQLILGRAMQILNDEPVLEIGEEEPYEELYVSIHSQSMDELTNIWNNFQEDSFQPSVSYLVTPVIIESSKDKPVQRVVERHIGRAQPRKDGEE